MGVPAVEGPVAEGPAAEGGDPVCWLDRVCPACGAFAEGEPAGPCWRCGHTTDGGRV